MTLQHLSSAFIIDWFGILYIAMRSKEQLINIELNKIAVNHKSFSLFLNCFLGVLCCFTNDILLILSFILIGNCVCSQHKY